MHHFDYRAGVLHAENVSLARLAAEVGTPFYCYSTATLERHYQVLAKAFETQRALICYAVKACSNQGVLATMARLGAGMDVVSEGELRRARAAGVAADKIIFAGVGKTREEMAYALKEGILGFNVESEPELEALSEVAASLRATARIAVRVNPDVDAKTHAKISTGKAENKFGIPYERAVDLYAIAHRLPGIKVSGIHMHIGSQITALAPFRDAFRLMRDLAVKLRSEGHALEHLDIGGGLGVPYGDTIKVRGHGSDESALKGSDARASCPRLFPELGMVSPPHPDEYAAVVKAALGDLKLKIVLEPGRMIAGNAGILVTRVIYAKEGAGRTFTIVDAAMNDLIRPTLYDAHHEIWPVAEAKRKLEAIEQDVVGPVCETGDYLALARKLPPFAPGDLMAVMTAGAYGAVMASEYNTRPLVPEVLVKGAEYCVVRARPTYDEMLAREKVPAWLSA